jgi:hypothetical protein
MREEEEQEEVEEEVEDEDEDFSGLTGCGKKCI